jgi:putative transposase
MWAKGNSINYEDTAAALTAWKKEPECIWLNEVSNVCLQQALRQLNTAYRNFFAKRAKFPRYRRKGMNQSVCFTQMGFRYRDGEIILAKMDAPLNVVWHRPLPGHPSSVTVILEATGDWYLSCVVDFEPEVMPQAGNNAIGIDLGLNHFVVLSDGEKIDNPRHFRKAERRLACEQRRLARKKKGSKNREKAKRKVARAHARVRRARADFHHKLSRRIISENQVICVENLSVKGMARTKLAKSIADAGWSSFIDMLKYKAKWYGRELIQIDRFAPTTRTCSGCGVVHGQKELSVREWTCEDCGAEHDRDVNAAINIMVAGTATAVCGASVRPAKKISSRATAMKQKTGGSNSRRSPLHRCESILVGV